MYAEHWRRLVWATPLGNFPILLVQLFFGALMNSYLLTRICYCVSNQK